MLNGCMQLRLRHLDQCRAWVKTCEIINYGQNKSAGNEPWSQAPSFQLNVRRPRATETATYNGPTSIAVTDSTPSNADTVILDFSETPLV